MQIQATAAACCTTDSDGKPRKGIKEQVLAHLRNLGSGSTYVSITDPEWTNQPCDMSLWDLKQMGFDSVLMVYGPGPRQRFDYAL